MVLYFKSTGVLDLLPEPDPDAKPSSTADNTAIFSIDRELGPWTRIRRTDRTTPPQEGWVLKNKLQVIDVSDLKMLKLFAEPMGAIGESVEARIVQELLRLDPWTKVLVQRADGTTAKGWITPETGSPAPAATTMEQATTGSPELDLGVNEVFRPALLLAQRKTGIDAAALAALVDAEAGRISKGPRKGQWNPDALNEDSGAAGLTQFLRSTWLDHAMKSGTELNARARKDGLIGTSGELLPGQEGPLLQLRFDPTLAILSAAEYGRTNFKGLIKRGLAAETDTDDRKAELMYLAHHEGLGGAIGFLDRTKAYSFDNLKGQVGDAAGALVAQAGGDANAAYRTWLTGYITKKIVLARFRKPGNRPGPGQPEKLTAVNSGAPAGGGVQVQAYSGMNEQTASALKAYSGPAIPFPMIGGEPALARLVQEALSVHGYLDPPADGEFGPVSIWALTQFARKAGLGVEGGLTQELAALLTDPGAGLPMIKLTGHWIERAILSMQSRGHFINRHPDCCNILYLEGVSPDGTLNDDRPNSFNDLRIVFWVTKTGAIDCKAWDATSEPGDFWTFNPMNPKGAARIAFGQYKAWAVGQHLAGKPSGHEALVQVKPISVHRDFNQDNRRTGDLLDTGIFGVNQHWGYDATPNDIKNTSAGCLVGRSRDGHREFMSLIKGDARFKTSKGYRFVTTVLPGDKI